MVGQNSRRTPRATLWASAAAALRYRVAQNLDRCIAVRGKSILVTAELIGRSRQYVQAILSARVSVGLDVHNEIAVGLEIDPGALVGHLPDPLVRVQPRAESLREVLARNLRAGMRKSGLSPQELAIAAGLSKRTVYDVLNLERAVGYDGIAAFAAALGVTEQRLLAS